MPANTMVMPERSQSEPFTIEARHAVAILAKLYDLMAEIGDKLSKDNIDIDMWISLPLATNFIPLKQYNGPYVITSFYMAFPVASTSVILQLGARTIPVTDFASGQFGANDLRIQMDRDDLVQMVVAPAGIGHLEVMGYADHRETNMSLVG